MEFCKHGFCPTGGERSAPGLLLLSRPRFRPSRGRAGVSLGLDGCEVRLCDPCARLSHLSRFCSVCVPAPPGVFLPISPVCVPAPGSPRCLFTGKSFSQSVFLPVGTNSMYWVQYTDCVCKLARTLRGPWAASHLYRAQIQSPDPFSSSWMAL